MSSKMTTIESIKRSLREADAVLIGAGAGLSTSAGFIYNGERFRRYFGDFIGKYGFLDMYEGGFYPFQTTEEHWAYWSRYIYINRYMNPPKPTYERLFDLVKDKDYFVLTTNVDHCFQKAGFAKDRLFYTQGDFGLFQCSEPCHDKTYDNEDVIRKMVLAQGFQIEADGTLPSTSAENLRRAAIQMTVPAELIPKCPVCGRPMSMNLRADNTFVQDEGWYQATARYQSFVKQHKSSNITYLELGVGMNTPVIIKYNFWEQTAKNPKARYLCLNKGQAFVPHEIEAQSICLDSDIGDVLNELNS